MKPSIYINSEGIVCYIENLPYESNHDQIVAAKASAVRFEKQDEAHEILDLVYNDTYVLLPDSIHPFPSEKYSVEIKWMRLEMKPPNDAGKRYRNWGDRAVLSPVQKNESQEELWLDLMGILIGQYLKTGEMDYRESMKKFTILRKVKE